jgi:4-hydroxy-tetrahydrodipicolinate synthase
MGGNGIISVTSNILPKMVSDLQKATAINEYKTALKIQDQLTNFHSAMFCETNPIPVKYALSLMGFCENEIRLPLVAPSLETQSRIKAEMKRFNLI